MSEDRATYAALQVPEMPLVRMAYLDQLRYYARRRPLIDPDHPFSPAPHLAYEADIRVDGRIYHGAGSTEKKAIEDALSVAKECLGMEVVLEHG